MKIKELSNLLNVSQKTIRYYEDCGFIMPLTQNKSGRIFRDYDEAAITQLKTIIGLRKLRFSIDEIKALFAEPEKLAEICNTHRNNLEREIGVMTQICKLLDDVYFSHINEAKDLTEQVEMLRRETILDDYFSDYDLSTFDEPFTDYDLRKQKTDEHKEYSKLVASSYYFAHPKVKSNLQGGAIGIPR